MWRFTVQHAREGGINWYRIRNGTRASVRRRGMYGIGAAMPKSHYLNRPYSVTTATCVLHLSSSPNLTCPDQLRRASAVGRHKATHSKNKILNNGVHTNPHRN